MTGTVKIKKKVGKRTITKATSVVLASTMYKLAKGRSGRFNLTLTKIGRSSLAQANATSPLRATLIASVKGGATATKAVVVGGSQFVGTYALTVAPNFCGPIGRQTSQVMYVQGSAVTDPVGGGYGPFTGTARAQGTGYHLILVQPANEIMDDITITLSNGGNDITGTGQDNLEAGNNAPCPVSFTGLRTSTSVPTSAPTTTTTTPPAATSTSVPPVTTTTTAATPVSQITIASLDAVLAQQANAVPPSPGQPPGSWTVTCGPPSASLAVGSDILCESFNPAFGDSEEVIQITGSTPSSFTVVAGPGSSFPCSSLNAAEQAAFTADGNACTP
jgi:hypothetical protein